MNREELFEKYGRPVWRDDDIKGLVIVFGHRSREAAQAYVDANIEHYGHKAWLERRKEEWVSVVDLRPAISKLEKEFTDGQGRV